MENGFESTLNLPYQPICRPKANEKEVGKAVFMSSEWCIFD